MTQKELSYLEDAVSHECIMIKVLDDTKNKLTDQELVNFVSNEVNVHETLKQNLLNLLEEKANE